MNKTKRAFFLINSGIHVWADSGFLIFLAKLRKKIQRTIKANLWCFLWREVKTIPYTNKMDVICFSLIDWDFRFQRPQQILTKYAHSGYRVFYTSTRLNEFGQKEILTEIIEKNIFEVLLPGDTNVNLYQDTLTEEASIEISNALFRFITKQNIIEATCLVQYPFWTPIAQILKEKYGWKVIYDCMDDYSAFNNSNINIVELENEILATCDLVVTTSTLLHQKLSTKHPNCVLIPNAGDYQHFCRIQPSEEKFLSKLSHPIIGYYGAIAEWFDVESVLHAALNHPEWSFVLIGDTFSADIKDISNLSNVHFLGEKPYLELPEYIINFDVCTIPFSRTPLTEAANPVKIYEYLSAGKSIVARNLPELVPFSDLLYLYNTPAEFNKFLEQAIAEDSLLLHKKRQAVARQNTWEMRYQSIKASIETLYDKASIIIVTWENLEFTQKCIQSVLADQTWPNYEIIVVDNASKDGTEEYLKLLSEQTTHVKVFFNKENLGFATANNIGLKSIQDSKFVVLLNNDTVVSRGWLARLLRHAKQPDVGMVGPVTNSAGNEARIDVPYMDLSGMESFASDYTTKHYDMVFDINMLAMYCVAMRKEVFDQIGTLDERFGVGMFEDDDYSHRVRRAGYRLICAEDVFIHHYGRISLSKLGHNEYYNLFERNRRLYEEKWDEVWIPHKYRRG